SLISIVDALLWKVENIDANRAETGHAHLSDWPKRRFGAQCRRIGRISYRAGVRHKLAASYYLWQGRVKNQRRIQQERHVRQAVARTSEHLIAQLLKVQTRPSIR